MFALKERGEEARKRKGKKQCENFRGTEKETDSKRAIKKARERKSSVAESKPAKVGKK